MTVSDGPLLQAKTWLFWHRKSFRKAVSYNPSGPDVGEQVNIDVAAVAQLANTVFAATRQEARVKTPR